MKIALYLVHMALFLMVTFNQIYNYEEDGLTMPEMGLWLFNLSSIMYEFYRGISSPNEYFADMANQVEFIKAVLWMFLSYLRFISPAEYITKYVEVATSNGTFSVDCGFEIDINSYIADDSNVSNLTWSYDCTRNITRYEPYDVSDWATRNTLQVGMYQFLWALQCILFWITIMAFQQRSAKVGPLLKMIGMLFL